MTVRTKQVSTLGIVMRWIVCVIAMTLLSPLASAFTPTQEQIEQFMSMSPAEQERIARQFGVDINELKSMANSSSQPAVQERMPAGMQERRKVWPFGPSDNMQPATVKNGERSGSEMDSKSEVDSESGKKTRKTLRNFGYELFENNASAFQPNIDIPVPADYVVGPGDTFVIQLYGNRNASYNLEVSREGIVQFPEIGPISLAGLKFSEAQGVIERTVSEQMIGVKSAVTMGTLRTIRVFVLGDAVQPGSYIVGSLSTMTNALFASGGVNEIGSLRNIQLKRQGKVVTTLDLYDLLLSGDTRNDARLLPGDVIFIPPIGATIGVDGEVRRPAIYEIKQEKTMGDAIRLAGGMMPTAYPQASRVERINERGDRTVVDVNLSTSSGKSLAVKSGDVVRIYSVLDTQENIITVEGHVKRPGITAWRPGIRVSQVLGGMRELLPNPDLNAALILRETQPTRKLTVVLFNPGEALTNPGSAADPELQPRDTLAIFNLESDRSKELEDVIDRLRTQADRANRQKVVSISGNVRFPGDYPMTPGMSANELIQLAGGLNQNAYDLEAEITRYTLDEQQRQQIDYISLPLAASPQQQLQEEDLINIRRLPQWAPEETIELTGEVVFPGKYTIRRGEMLSHVIQRAGGLTDQAYAHGAIFTRKELKILEEQRLQELKNRLESDIAAANIEQQDDAGKVEVKDAEQLLKNIESVKPLGRMVIDLPLILSDTQTHDVRIVSGDNLHVPRFKQAVTVVGEVQYPTSHLYQRNLDVQDYIERSGGTNLKADRGRVYVVKANGRVFLPQKSGWFSRDMVEIEPGDTVVVPLDADRIKSLTLWTNISQVFYQVALGAAAVASF